MIGNKLKKRATELGLSNSDVARMLDMQPRRYNNYVNNEREPDYETLLKICKVLGVSTDYLFGLTDNASTHKYTNNVKKLRETLGLSIVELAEMTGIDAPTINKLEKGQEHPNNDSLIKLSKIFNCDIDEIIEENTPTSIQSKIKKARIKANLSISDFAELLKTTPNIVHNLETGATPLTLDWIERISKALNTSIQELAYGITQYENYEGSIFIRQIPVLSFDKIEQWIETQFIENDTKWIGTTNKISLKSYALVINHDMMEPRFPSGSTVIVDPEAEIQNGDCVIAKTSPDSAPVFKKYIKEGEESFLKPLNTAYPVSNVTDKELTFLGRAIQIMMKID